MPTTGEQPGKGRYVCLHCGEMVRLGKKDTLPPCPRCGKTVFRATK